MPAAVRDVRKGNNDRHRQGHQKEEHLCTRATERRKSRTGENKIAAVRYTRKRINKKERQEKQTEEPTHTHTHNQESSSQGYV